MATYNFIDNLINWIWLGKILENDIQFVKVYPQELCMVFNLLCNIVNLLMSCTAKSLCYMVHMQLLYHLCSLLILLSSDWLFCHVTVSQEVTLDEDREHITTTHTML